MGTFQAIKSSHASRWARFQFVALLGAIGVFSPHALSAETTNSTLQAPSPWRPSREMLTGSSGPPIDTYQAAALKALIKEANVVAAELALNEFMPIVQSNVVQYFILPFDRAQRRKAVGTLVTSNYAYYVSINNRFCYLEFTRQQEAIQGWLKQYSWPMDRLDTNAAYQLATQKLASVSMDVPSLSRDCDVHIVPLKGEGNQSKPSLLPVYWIYWSKRGNTEGSVASVEVFLPTRMILTLRVEDGHYISRPPIQVAP
jgi:hypothetical protein